MRKIISLFQRNHETDRLVRDEVTPGAEWVQAGEGVATRKLDGTCCMVRDGRLYKRHEVKDGRLPAAWVPAQPKPDPVTGEWPGWLPVGEGLEDRWHREAVEGAHLDDWPNGTYELLGPKIQGNPEEIGRHSLFSHGALELFECPRTYEELREYLDGAWIEGVVWHHPDGRMVKIKARDFGRKRGG
jgi:hypothetical protein